MEIRFCDLRINQTRIKKEDNQMSMCTVIQSRKHNKTKHIVVKKDNPLLTVQSTGVFHSNYE